ncbi:hypothetical protein ES705_51170 [subsurface metagenome]
MKSLSGQAELEHHSSSLDSKSTSARKAMSVPEAKRFKRMYHRVRSGLERTGNVRLLTLTSSPGGGDFQRDFRMLIMRLRRRGLVTDYIRCPEKTRTGLRHDHILFRGSYIEQAYLSYLWGEIHNAPVVDIRRVGGRHRLACYLANYLAKSPSGRYSYSWAWVWKGFSRSWAVLKRASRDFGWNYKQLLTNWQWCIRMNKKPEDRLREIGYVFCYL